MGHTQHCFWTPDHHHTLLPGASVCCVAVNWSRLTAVTDCRQSRAGSPTSATLGTSSCFLLPEHEMSHLVPLALLASADAAAPAGGNQQNAETQEYLTYLNKNLSENYAWSLLAFAACIFIYRSSVRVYAHMRHLASLTATSQKYFAEGDSRVNWLKRHILYAPTFRHKRATEIQFHRYLNFGSIPTRFQTVFITACIVVNVWACCWEVPWNDERLQVSSHPPQPDGHPLCRQPGPRPDHGHDQEPTHRDSRHFLRHLQLDAPMARTALHPARRCSYRVLHDC